jgi:hypothetical protein
MRTPRLRHFALATAAAGLLLASGCKKETDPRVHPDMVFKTGPGYTSADDTVGTDSALVIGVIITKTEDPLIALNVSVAYDGGGSSTVHNQDISGEHVEYDHQLTTRSQAGSEKWIFSVTDRDGNITTKSIMLTVLP